MSKPALIEQDNTARVWQPLDFLSPEGTGKNFVKQSFADNLLPAFEPFDLKKWEQEAEKALAVKRAALAQAKAEAARLSVEIDEIENSEKFESQHNTQSSASQVDLKKAALSEAELKKISDEAYAKGVAEGRRLQREEMEKQQAVSAARAEEMLKGIDTELWGLMQDPQRWFDPLKRLALHLAEELVLAELTLSPSAIEGLIQGCVDELSASEVATVKLELNPKDAQLLADKGIQSPLWKVISNDKLLPGSVRASADDSLVCDLVEHRLATLAEKLLINPTPALENSLISRHHLTSPSTSDDPVQGTEASHD